MTINLTSIPAPRRLTNRRIVIILAAMVIMPIFLTILVAMTVGLTRAIATPDAPQVDQVKVFNEGFADSKQDDCQQGFAPACDWLNAR